MTEKSPGQRLYSACFRAFAYTKDWSAGTPAQHRKYELAAHLFTKSDPLAAELLEALKEARSALAMAVEPAEITGTTVLNAWTQIKAAEAKARAAIAKAEALAAPSQDAA